MKYILIILALYFAMSFTGIDHVPDAGKMITTDTVPTGAAPQLFGSKLYEFRNYVLVDSFLLKKGGDTFATPRWPAIQFRTADRRWYGHDSLRWKGFAYAGDSGTVNAINGLSITGSTIKMGGPFTETTFIRTSLNRSNPDALSNKFLFISNVPGDSSAYSNYFINSSYDRPGLIVNRQYGNDDTLFKQYGGAIMGATKMVFDASNTRYKSPSTPLTMTYGGTNMLSQLFPPDTAYMLISIFGNTGSAYSGDIGIGGFNKYNLTLLSGITDYPFPVYRGGIDYARSVIDVKRELRGNPSGSYVADWKSQQENINSGTTEYGSYINKNFGFMAYGTINPQLTSPSKAKTLAVSTMDTAIGFLARPMWTTLNEVKNGYGFINEGTGDYNFFAGNTKFGGTMPSTANVQTRRVNIDSTVQVGGTLATNTFFTNYWKRLAVTPANFNSAPTRGMWIQNELSFDQNVNISNTGITAVRGELDLYADSVLTLSSTTGVGVMGANFGLFLRKKTGYLDTTTWVGSTNPASCAAALTSRFDMSGTAGVGSENIGTGYFASFQPNYIFSNLNKVDNAIWINVGTGQFGGTTNAVNGYGVYINGFPSQVTNKYAIYQAGTLDTNKYFGPAHFPTSKLIAGDLGSSTAKLQVMSGATFNTGPYQSVGPVLSNSIYSTLHTSDTVTAANVSSAMLRGFQMNRNIVFSDNGANLSDKEGSVLGLVLRVKDSISIDPVGSDLAYANSSILSLRKYGGFNGRTVIQSGLQTYIDASCAQLSSIDIAGTTSPTNNFRLRGHYASHTSYIIDGAASKRDTMDNWIGYFATGFIPGLHVKKGTYLTAQSISADSLYAFSFDQSDANAYLQGRFGIGTGPSIISNAFGFFNNRTSGQNKDSLPIVNSITNEYIRVIDTTTGQDKRIASSSLYTFNSGLTNTSGTVRWNGALLESPTIDGGSSFFPTFTSSRTGTNSTITVTNTSSGRGVSATSSSGVAVYGSSSSSIGTYGQSTDSYGIWGQSTNAPGLYASSTGTVSAAQIVISPASTNTQQTVLELHRASQSAGGNNIAGSIDFHANNNTGAGSEAIANQLIWSLTDVTAGAETSRFTIKGRNSGVATTLATFDGNGALLLNKYGVGSFTGTPAYNAQFDASGNLIEAPINLTNTATLDFPNTVAGTSSDLTITVTGAADGDVVAIGVPNASTVANGCFTAWVSASNTVTIRYSNNDALSAYNPASGTFKATIIRH